MSKARLVGIAWLALNAMMSAAIGAQPLVNVSACGRWDYGTNYGAGANATALFSVDFQQSGKVLGWQWEQIRPTALHRLISMMSGHRAPPLPLFGRLALGNE